MKFARLSSAFNQFVGKIHVTSSRLLSPPNAVRAEMENIKSLTQGVAEFFIEPTEEARWWLRLVHEMQATGEAVSNNAH